MHPKLKTTSKIRTNPKVKTLKIEDESENKEEDDLKNGKCPKMKTNSKIDSNQNKK